MCVWCVCMCVCVCVCVPGGNSGVAKVEGVFGLEEGTHTHLPDPGDRGQLAQSNQS